MRTTAAAAFALAACAAATGFAQDETAIQKTMSDFTAAWNRHDVKAMTAVFTEDADLINPFGRLAKGRVDIEKLFQQEQTTIMKESTYKLGEGVIRLVAPTVAVSDFDGEILGVHGPAGEPAPPFKHHVTSVHVKKGGKWMTLSARAYVYVPEPGNQPNVPSSPPRR